jgi:transposase
MRVADIFKRLLGVDAVCVRDVEVVEVSDAELVTITLERRRNRKMHCGRCGQRARAVYDRQIRSWRHLDAFRVRCIVRAEVRRVICPGCGICAESVPRARPGSRSGADVRGHVCVAGPLGAQERRRTCDAQSTGRRWAG